MFLTTDANKHPLSTIYGKGKHLWTGIDVQIRRPWLLVDFQLTLRDEDGDEVTDLAPVVPDTIQSLS